MENIEKGGKWYSVPCAMNCGANCVNKVLMKDGEVIRCKTDDAYPDTWERPQARACPIGWSQQQKVFGPDRLQYPIKRKHWSPNDPHGELRGRDEWERITWDEALDYIAEELKKAKAKYGAASILYQNIVCLEGYLAPVLAQFGGYTAITSVDSQGTFQYNTLMYGLQNLFVNDRFDNEKGDWIVLYGSNAAWAQFSYVYYLKRAHQKGVRFAFVGPEYNVTAATFDAEWFPVRQGTDTAFLLGVAYSMIEQGLVDKGFLDKYTVGFDAGHMPADARLNENFHDYVMGEYDGTRKTPAWASEICGCPIDRIEEFARIMGAENKVSTHANGAPARNTGAENFPQLLMTISAMGGHFGSSGNACSLTQGSAFDGGPRLAINGPSGHPFVFNPYAFSNPVTNIIPSTYLWSAVLDGHYYDCGDVLLAPHPCEERDIDIHVIISEQNNRLQTCEGMSKGIEAYRKVDFVCSQAYSLKTDAVYSDIVLPIATRWERQMYNFYTMAVGNRDCAYAHEQVMEPLYESWSDYDVAVELAKRLGVDPTTYLGISEKQGWMNSIAGTVVADFEAHASITEGGNEDHGQLSAGNSADLAYKPLVTITQKDLDEYGLQGVPQQGIIPLKQYLEDGIYRVERTDGDNTRFIAYEDFIADPIANPLTTASGKFEIYCQTKSDWFDNIHEGWPNYVPVSPLPKYLPTLRGYIQSFADWDNKVKGEYPFQISNTHNLRRAHTDGDNLKWLREIYGSPIMISRIDAEKLGIKSGDIVKIYNQFGSVLRPAEVTRTIMPGTVELQHGSSVFVDEGSGIDIAGADNMLCASDEASAFANNGWNSNLVNVEKYEGSIELQPDAEWAPRIPVMI